MTRQPGTSEGVSYQEPPYNGPFSRDLFDPNVFAVEDNPRNDEVRYCHKCRQVVIVDNRPLFLHPHFRLDEQGEVRS